MEETTEAMVKITKRRRKWAMETRMQVGMAAMVYQWAITVVANTTMVVVEDIITMTEGTEGVEAVVAAAVVVVEGVEVVAAVAAAAVVEAVLVPDDQMKNKSYSRFCKFISNFNIFFKNTQYLKNIFPF